MNQKRNILLKKLTAGLFLALFLFVHLLKVSHHHHFGQSVSKEIVKGSQLSFSSACSICDYQVAKDSYHFHEVTTIQNVPKSSPTYFFHDTAFVTSIGSTSSDRGPPVLI